MPSRDSALSQALAALWAERLDLSEDPELTRRLIAQYVAKRLSSLGIVEDEETLRGQERDLLRELSDAQARLSEVRRKLELRASVVASSERWVRQFAVGDTPCLPQHTGASGVVTTRKRGLPDSSGRGTHRLPEGVWLEAEITYQDGYKRRPSYLNHSHPMAKLAEGCGCYTEDWRQLAGAYYGSDVVLTVPAELRRKPTASSQGQSITVALRHWSCDQS